MPKEELQKEIEELKSKIEKIENTLKSHSHLGKDGSSLLVENTELTGKSLNIVGAGGKKDDGFILPLVISDAKSDVQARRNLAQGLYVQGDKDSSNEQVGGVFVIGKTLDVNFDLTKINQAQLILIHSPQSEAANSGPSTLAPLSFLIANRTPIFGGTGTLTTGGNTLVDSFKDLQSNICVGSILNILSGGLIIQSFRVISNTSNVLTVDGVWTIATGSYEYSLITPVLLGSADTPFSRLYVGEDIRMGYGPTSATTFIKWGTGSPEGVVPANQGSMYLRQDGSTSTTLYVKTSGSSTTGWTAK